MSKVLSLLLIALCALNSWAQSPLLKTVEKPDAASPTLRADGLLHSHWTQDYPYNQLCPRDPVNGNAYSVSRGWIASFALDTGLSIQPALPQRPSEWQFLQRCRMPCHCHGTDHQLFAHNPRHPFYR